MKHRGRGRHSGFLGVQAVTRLVFIAPASVKKALFESAAASDSSGRPVLRCFPGPGFPATNRVGSRALGRLRATWVRTGRRRVLHAKVAIGSYCKQWLVNRRDKGPLPAQRACARPGTTLARLMIVLSGNIRSPPPTIAPRQIPPAIGREHARHQIKPTRASGVAPAQPRERHPAPGPKSEPANRLVGVMRACWQVSAVHSDQQRKRAAV
jgi:hypothetical protein